MLYLSRSSSLSPSLCLFLWLSLSLSASLFPSLWVCVSLSIHPLEWGMFKYTAVYTHTGSLVTEFFNPFPYSTAMSWHLSTFRTFFCSLLLFSLPNVGFLWSHLPLFCIWSRQMPSFPLFGLPIPSASAGPPGLPCLKNLPHCKIIPMSSDWICDYWSIFTLGMKSCCTFPGYHLYCISIHKYTHVPVLLLCDQSRVEFYTSPPSSS